VESVIKGRWRELPRGAGRQVPASVHKALQRGLATAPGDRFPSLAPLLVALEPERAQRRRIATVLTALAAVALTVGAGAWRLGHRSRLGMCSGAERKLAGVWDEAQRERVRAAFGKSGRVFAAPVLRTVESVLDGYAGSWVKMHVDACEATHLRAEQSQELLDLRMSCLDERLTELKTLSAELAEADGGLVERAAKAVQSLPRIERCGDVAALRAPVPPPADPTQRGRVAAVRQQLARAEALELAGKFPEGLRLSKEALAAATPLDYAPLTGEAFYHVGSGQLATGEFAPAAESLHHAFVAALAGRHDELAANATLALVSVVGEREGHFDEGARFADLAQALAGRVHDRDELLGGIANRRSALFLRQGKPIDALREAELGVEYTRRAFGATHQRLADAYHGVANAYYQSGHYQEAIANFDRALAISGQALGLDHPRVAVLLLNLAAAYGDSGDHAGAIAQDRRALAIFEKNEGTPPGHIANVLNNMGDDLRATGHLDEAIACYRRALELWRRGDGSVANANEIAVARHNIGESKLDQGDPKGALADFRELLAERLERQGPAHPDVAFERWGVGEAQRRLGHLDEAEAQLSQALALWEKALGHDHPYLQQPLFGLGRIRLVRHQLEQASTLLQRAKAIGDAQPADQLLSGQIRLALADVQWELGHGEAARRLASEAKKAFADAGPRAASDRAAVEAWLTRHPDPSM
jgi:tetratricopeptide (TPR) repeat protein